MTAYVALVEAITTAAGPEVARRVLTDSVAAVSVGIVGGLPVADLDYAEDSQADVDMNVVMTGAGKFVEVQGTGERTTFDEQELAALLALARGGLRDLQALQRTTLGDRWPLASA